MMVMLVIMMMIPIDVTLVGIVTDVREVQDVKALASYCDDRNDDLEW